MGRGYTVERYKKIIKRIRDLIPNASISADAIVAFPGESQEDFNQTLSIIDDIKFDLVNTAAYSPRPNTPASTWPDQLPEEIKIERLRILNDLVENTAREKNLR